MLDVVGVDVAFDRDGSGASDYGASGGSTVVFVKLGVGTVGKFYCLRTIGTIGGACPDSRMLSG